MVSSGWSNVRAVDINDGGCIVGTAVYSAQSAKVPIGETIYSSADDVTLTTPSDGLHAVLLVPCQILLLTGATQDFDETMPTNLIPAPEFPKYQNSVTTVGSDHLGVQPMGDGRSESVFVHNAYTFQTLAAARAPATLPNIVYGWSRKVSHRSWYVKKNNTGTAWNVTLRTSIGASSPEPDSSNSDFYNTNPSSQKKEFYFEDASALGHDSTLPDNTLKVGDYIHEEKAFLYIVQISFDGLSYSDGVFMSYSQNETIRCKATGGTAATDWEGSPNLVGGNIYTVGNVIPKIDQSKIRAIVGPGLAINIDPNANGR